jgi:hypothetical protein
MRTFLKNVLLTAAVLTAAAISYRACHDESDGPINPADRGGVASIHPEEMREQRAAASTPAERKDALQSWVAPRDGFTADRNLASKPKAVPTPEAGQQRQWEAERWRLEELAAAERGEQPARAEQRAKPSRRIKTRSSTRSSARTSRLVRRRKAASVRAGRGATIATKHRAVRRRTRAKASRARPALN